MTAWEQFAHDAEEILTAALRRARHRAISLTVCELVETERERVDRIAAEHDQIRQGTYAA